MTDLAKFLLARIAEDEALANDALHPDADRPGEWVTEHHNSEYHSEPNRARIAEDRSGHYWSVAHEVFIPVAEHMARHDPARVLAECSAKRLLVEWIEYAESSVDRGADFKEPLRLLALPYADHDDYRQEWLS